MLNLVDNAIKFSSAGGEVVVTLQAFADSAEITVADSGPGIPAEQTELIFERFYRGSNNHSAQSAERASVSPLAAGSRAPMVATCECRAKSARAAASS